MQPEQSVSALRRSMNDTLYQRNVPSHALQPSFDVRPTMTKYSHLPMVDLRKPNHTPVQISMYQPTEVFYGGDRKAPWDGFARHVDHESQLRNQLEPLVKGGVRDPYIPSSQSDLYEYMYLPSTAAPPTTHAALFAHPHSFPAGHRFAYSASSGHLLFHNPTREQIKSAAESTTSFSPKQSIP